jgi:hypothetical protein
MFMNKHRTQKEIKLDIEKIESDIDDIENYRKHIPGYEEMEKKLQALRYKYMEDIRNQVNVWKSDVDALKKEIKNIKLDKELVPSDKISLWFRNYKGGVHWGYGGLKIAWISDDERFVILTHKGGTAGQGTAMGTGGYYYAPSNHWIADTSIATGHRGYGPSGNSFMETEGRLTKELKEKMIAHMEELRKEKK